jgi:hypothetical protein
MFIYYIFHYILLQNMKFNKSIYLIKINIFFKLNSHNLSVDPVYIYQNIYKK